MMEIGEIPVKRYTGTDRWNPMFYQEDGNGEPTLPAHVMPVIFQNDRIMDHLETYYLVLMNARGGGNLARERKINYDSMEICRSGSFLPPKKLNK